MIESTLFHWQSVDMYVDNIHQGTVNVQHATSQNSMLHAAAKYHGNNFTTPK